MVLLELVEPLDARILGVGGDPVDVLSVRRVHAALSDPDAPGGPGPSTRVRNGRQRDGGRAVEPGASEAGVVSAALGRIRLPDL
ncbi:hypothetical protein [Kitasatospora sp. NPDC088264]|uniref:hypothetical protein n=1 Tax=unclassified Kitasatospora TaxID=2633591 RepID=UPI0034324B6D